jgi:hypothetical protein
MLVSPTIFVVELQDFKSRNLAAFGHTPRLSRAIVGKDLAFDRLISFCH